MREEISSNLSAQLERMLLPAQQASTLFLNNMERLTDFQLELMQRYTHFTLEQWRDALEIHDARSFRDYLDKRNRMTQELTRQFNEDFRRMLGMGQELAEQVSQVGRRTAEAAASTAESAAQGAAESAQRSGKRA